LRSCCWRSFAVLLVIGGVRWPPGHGVSNHAISRAGRLTLRRRALLFAILIGPVIVVCWRTFDQGAERLGHADERRHDPRVRDRCS
jgi:hypothetical protein